MTEPPREFQPVSESELARRISELADGAEEAVVPCGGRTSLSFGSPVTHPSMMVSLSSMSTVDDYPARDMTITVGAGMRIDELNQLLGEHDQQLPLDIAQGSRATIGGVVACNTSGPRRYGYGTIRDYVIGIRAVDGNGRAFAAGGRVVKNVAGYDVCKLLVGSLGTLAVVTQVTLKLKPVPESSGLLWTNLHGYDDVDVALETMISSDTRPRSIDVLSPVAAGTLAREIGIECPDETPVLCLGFDGTQAEVDWQIQTATHELTPFGPDNSCALGSEDTRAFWNALAEFGLCGESPLTCQTALRPSGALELLEEADRMGAASVANAGSGIVISQSPESLMEVDEAQNFLQRLQRTADHHLGRVQVLDCTADWSATVASNPLPEGTLKLASRIKWKLDPKGILSPGRIPYAQEAAR